MTHKAQAPNSTLFSIAAPLPSGGGVPEWITIFPQLGKITARDGRSFTIDGAALLAAFRADGIDIPVDEMHQTDTAMASGGAARAVGWINDLRIQDGKLEGHVDWTATGKALLAARAYRYTSPSFYDTPQRLRAVALVTAPALGNQPALAAANPSPESSMKSIATFLGLQEDANEASCLSALTTRMTGMVPKTVLDETVTKLAAATAELDALKSSARGDKVNALIEGALKAKKIIPAEKDHFVALCATDAGLESVEKLFASKPALLAASDLDNRTQPEPGAQVKAEQLAAKASKLVADARAAGVALAYADAVAQAAAAGDA